MTASAALGLAGLILLLAGAAYALGRRAGHAEGAARARAELPLEFRAELLEEARCPVCGRPAPFTPAGGCSSASGG